MKEIIILGSGSSTGVPILTCQCDVCKSKDPKDKRSRPSLLMRSSKETIIIDTSADFRTQMLTNNVMRLDAVLLTHAHHDHVAGLDEIRIYNFKQGKSIPIYGNESTLNEIKRRYFYFFEETQEGGGKPKVELKLLPPKEEIQFKDFKIKSVNIIHGNVKVNGYIINDKLAYLTDCSYIPEQTLEIVKNIDILILGAIRVKPHPTHFCFEEALEIVKIIKPKKAFFTHLTHDLSHKELEKKFSPEITIPYDGYKLEI